MIRTMQMIQIIFVPFIGVFFDAVGKINLKSHFKVNLNQLNNREALFQQDLINSQKVISL